MRVASRDNPRYKAVKRLIETPATRKSERQTVLEGAHLCAAYLEQVGVPLTCVVSSSAMQDAEVSAIAARVPDAQLLEVDDRLYHTLSALENSLALMFVIEVPQATLPATQGPVLVLIDRLQDPGNLGSILRCCAASGATSVLLSEGCVSPWSPKVLRAGMGAHFLLSLHEAVDLAAFIAQCKRPVYATSSHATRSIYQLDLGVPCAWLFGNEGQGIDAALLGLTQPVSIPQPGGEESLNVAAAAAICLFEGVRQRLSGAPTSV